MTEEGLSSKLYHFSKVAIRKARENEHKINKITQLYVKSTVPGSHTIQEYIPKEVLNLKDVVSFLDGIKQLEEYSVILSDITKRYSLSRTNAENLLRSFIDGILFNNNMTGFAWKTDEDIDDGILLDQVTLFVSDLEKVPPIWQVKMWIIGLDIDDEMFDINKNIQIRKIKSSDIEIEMPLDSILLRAQFERFHYNSSVILELKYKGNLEEIYDEIYVILTSFILFKVGSVDKEKVEYHPKSFTNDSFSSYSNIHKSPRYKYIIRSEDVPKINELTKIIKNNLPILFNKEDPIHIALQRYNDAIIVSDNIENQITTTINCLEALYLKKEEQTELSRRLGQRVSGIFRFLDYTPLKVYNDVTRAYDIRSKYIHGQINPEKHKNIRKLAEDILEYARISILVHILLSPDISKEQIINKIDNSLLDSAAYSKLEEIIRINRELLIEIDEDGDKDKAKDLA